jgi:predicted hotdog family 3-hydroxylacyl-ACP dehydratase
MGSEEIAALIPHRGSMCLLDHLVSWDHQAIEAVAVDVHSQDNPLREGDVLQSIVLVEYAAQAAAIHAALTEGSIGGSSAAYIGAIKSMTLHQPRVDPSDSELHCAACCVLNNANGAIYQLTVSANQKLLMDARVVLVLP